MCYSNCSYFNRYTEKSTCRRGRDGLLPCEREEAERDDDELLSLDDLDGEVYAFEAEDRRIALKVAQEMMRRLGGECCVS